MGTGDVVAGSYEAHGVQYGCLWLLTAHWMHSMVYLEYLIKFLSYVVDITYWTCAVDR